MRSRVFNFKCEWTKTQREGSVLLTLSLEGRRGAQSVDDIKIFCNSSAILELSDALSLAGVLFKRVRRRIIKRRTYHAAFGEAREYTIWSPNGSRVWSPDDWRMAIPRPFRKNWGRRLIASEWARRSGVDTLRLNIFVPGLDYIHPSKVPYPIMAYCPDDQTLVLPWALQAMAVEFQDMLPEIETFTRQKSGWC